MQVIDPAGWKRKPLCDFFGRLDFPFYGVTFRVDVTRLCLRAKEEEGVSTYLAAIWASMRAVNGLDAFLYKLRGQTVVRHDALCPSFVVPTEDELFKIVHVDWLPEEPLADFCNRAQDACRAQETFINEADEARDDLVYISCLPWLDFTMLTNEMAFNRDDSIPRFAWGKFTVENGVHTMPYSVQVNHRLLDGRHIGAFYEALQRELNAL